MYFPIFFKRILFCIKNLVFFGIHCVWANCSVDMKTHSGRVRNPCRWSSMAPRDGLAPKETSCLFLAPLQRSSKQLWKICWFATDHSGWITCYHLLYGLEKPRSESQPRASLHCRRLNYSTPNSSQDFCSGPHAEKWYTPVPKSANSMPARMATQE